MNSNQIAETAKDQLLEPKLTLKPARLDFLSSQTQMVFAGIIAFFVVFSAWAPSLQCGFLLDDFLHLNYVSRAFHGDWSDFLGNFYSNWAGSDIMKSYRPLVSLSIFIDFIFWQGNPWGYHFTNLLLLTGCSIFVGLVTLELTGIMGNRLRAVASIWAATLFAVYPLQVEAATWIIGRVDLLCTLFYLASVFCFLRFRLVREKKYFVFSIIAFIAGILSKEMAYTLPVVITAAAFLLKEHSIISAPDDYKWKLRIQARTAVLTYWAIAGIGLMSRCVLLGTVVGGYGDGGAGGASGLPGVLNSLRNFLNPETIKQIVYPINLDLIARAAAYEVQMQTCYLLLAVYAGILALGLIRLLMNCVSKRVIAFLLLWTVVSVLPTFQIWHISPNLVGSRLFFSGSAPAIMLLVLLALPAIDAIKPGLAKIFAGIGAVFLFAILCIWTVCLQHNQAAWLEASREVQTFIESVSAAISNARPDKKILVLNLPTDYSGAGMITRPQYLNYALSQPFFPNNKLVSRVLTIEPPVGGSHEFLWPKTLQSMVNSGAVQVFDWRQSSLIGEKRSFLIDWARQQISGKSIVPRFLTESTATESKLERWSVPTQISKRDAKPIEIPWTKLGYFDDVKGGLSGEPLKILPVKKDEWTVVQNGGQRFEEISDGLVVTPGVTTGVMLVADLKEMDNLEFNTARILWRCLSGTCPDMTIQWLPKSTIENVDGTGGSLPVSVAEAQGSELRTKDSVLGSYSQNIVWLGRSRQWTLARPVARLALLLAPGNYSILLKGLEIAPQDLFVPSLKLDPINRVLNFDASQIKGANAVKLIVLAPNKTFDAIHAGEIGKAISSQSGIPKHQKGINQTAGKISCQEVLDDKSSCYVRIQALDAHGHELGLPSEPVLVERSNLDERRRH